MTRLRRAVFSIVALGGVAVPTALAASGSGQPTAAPAAQHIKVDKPFDIVLNAKGTPDASKLPTASTLFTKSELAQVVPGLTGVSVSDNTETLTAKGESSSTIQIVLKRFGTKNSVTAAWQKEKAAHQKRAARDTGLYTFFGNRLGATDAFTDGTNTHVLVSTNDAAGEVWFSGVGFTQLAEDYQSSRSAYETKVVPALVRLIADKLHDGAAKDAAAAQKAKPKASPAA